MSSAPTAGPSSGEGAEAAGPTDAGAPAGTVPEDVDPSAANASGADAGDADVASLDQPEDGATVLWSQCCKCIRWRVLSETDQVDPGCAWECKRCHEVCDGCKRNRCECPHDDTCIYTGQISSKFATPGMSIRPDLTYYPVWHVRCSDKCKLGGQTPKECCKATELESFFRKHRHCEGVQDEFPAYLRELAAYRDSCENNEGCASKTLQRNPTLPFISDPMYMNGPKRDRPDVWDGKTSICARSGKERRCPAHEQRLQDRTAFHLRRRPQMLPEDARAKTNKAWEKRYEKMKAERSKKAEAKAERERLGGKKPSKKRKASADAHEPLQPLPPGTAAPVGQSSRPKRATKLPARFADGVFDVDHGVFPANRRPGHQTGAESAGRGDALPAPGGPAAPTGQPEASGETQRHEPAGVFAAAGEELDAVLNLFEANDEPDLFEAIDESAALHWAAPPAHSTPEQRTGAWIEHDSPAWPPPEADDAAAAPSGNKWTPGRVWDAATLALLPAFGSPQSEQSMQLLPELAGLSPASTPAVREHICDPTGAARTRGSALESSGEAARVQPLAPRTLHFPPSATARVDAVVPTADVAEPSGASFDEPRSLELAPPRASPLASAFCTSPLRPAADRDAPTAPPAPPEFADQDPPPGEASDCEVTLSPTQCQSRQVSAATTQAPDETCSQTSACPGDDGACSSLDPGWAWEEGSSDVRKSSTDGRSSARSLEAALRAAEAMPDEDLLLLACRGKHARSCGASCSDWDTMLSAICSRSWVVDAMDAKLLAIVFRKPECFLVAD